MDIFSKNMDRNPGIPWLIIMSKVYIWLVVTGTMEFSWLIYGYSMVNLWLIMVNHWNSNTFGWWFGTIEFYDFPYIWNVIIPTDGVIFVRGMAQPPTRYVCT